MPWSPARRPSVFSTGGPPSQPVIGGGGGFSGGGSSGGGTRVGVNDPQLDEFVTGPFIQPPAGAATSGTSSLQRAFPERIGGNLVQSPGMETGLLEHAMLGIGRIGAHPIALADTITGGAITKGATAVDEGIPVLGDILGWGAEAVHNIFTLPAAIMNSEPSAVMAKLWNKGDDTVITAELLAKNGLAPNLASQFKKNGVFILGWTGITGEQMTVGDLKQELEGRGFLNAEGDPGMSISWEEFAGQVNGDALGSFKQGHASVNEDGLSDFALQTLWQGIETAPLSLAATLLKAGVVGGVGLAARMTGKGVQAIGLADEMDAAAAGIGAIARAAGRPLVPIWQFGVKDAARAFGKVGDDAVNQMARDGVIDRVALGVEEGAAQLAAGLSHGASMQSFALFAKKALYPNIPKLSPLQKYMVGQTNVRMASLGAEFGTGALENVIAGPDGTNVPMISDIHNFFEAVNNNTIVSDDMVFQTVLSFNMPIQALKPTARVATAPIRGYLNIGRAQTLERSLTLLERDLGKGSIEALGGRKAAGVWMDKMVQTIAFEKAMRGLPAGIKAAWESLPEATLRMRLIHNTIRAKAEFGVRKGQITASDIVSKFRSVHENPIRTHYNADGSIRRGPILDFHTKLSSEAIIRRANAYTAASAGLTDPILGMQVAVLGRAPHMAKEDLDFAIQTLEDSAINGKVDAQFVRDLFYETPGMLDDPFVSEGAHDFFVDAMNPVKNDALDVADVVGRLKELDPPTRDRMWHELSERDAAAGGVQHSGDTGAVSSGVARNVHSEETAKRFGLEADARVKSLKKQRVSLMEKYRSMFSKRGNYKPSQSDLNWGAASPEIAKTMAVAQVGHFSQVSGSPRNYTRGYDVPGRILGAIPEGDVAGMVEAARAVRREFPGADVRFTPSESHPGHLDVTGSYHFATEARARVKAAELQTTAIFNSADKINPRVPSNPVILVPKPVLDAKVAEIAAAFPKMKAGEAEAAAEVLRVMAQTHVRYNGGSPIDYLDNTEFVSGGRRGSGALRQDAYTRSVLREQRQSMHQANQARLSYQDMKAAGRDTYPTDIPTDAQAAKRVTALQEALGWPSREEVQILDDWSSILETHGHGASSQFKTVMDTTGRRLEVPTGDKPFSLEDAWKTKVQGVNPAKMAEADLVDLYQRTFAAHKGDLLDPVDNFRRTAFSMLSPNNNLTANEIGFAALGVRTFADIQRIAQMTDDQIIKTIMDVNAGFKSVGAQAKGVRTLAQKMVADPTLLNLRPGELPAAYITRLSENAGLNLKTANFAAMLSDPVTWPIGTIDVHVARELISGELSQYLRPDDWPLGLREKYLRTAKRSIDSKGKEVVTYAQPGAKGRGGPNATFTGSDYEKFSRVLEIATQRRYGDLPFGTAGKQWMHWDQVRGSYEPHTAAWPGTGNLPKVKAEVYLEAKAAHVNANYLNRNAEILGLPDEARFFQRAEGGATKGSIEWDARMKEIVRGYQSADVSTFVHEMGHKIRRELHPEDQLVAQQHYGVKEGKWTVKHEEQFARDFERYLHDGRAPTEELRSVFAKIATWMRDIYATLKGTPLEGKVAPEVRQLFDRALGKVDAPARIEVGPKWRKAGYAEYEAARGQSTRGEFMTPHDPAEFAKAKAFLSEDGKTGWMVSPEGDMQNLFNTGKKGEGAKAFQAQVDAGGRTLDAFDGYLPEYYAGMGFEEVARMKFNDEFAPPGWNYEKYGRPDVVFMSHTGKKGAPYVKTENYTTDWDAAKALSRERAVEPPPKPGADGPVVFEKEDATLMQQRESMREEVRSLDRQIGLTKNDIREVRARAKALKGGMNNLDDSFTELNADGTPRVTGASMKKVTEYTNWIRENYPQFEVEAGPRIMNLYEPDSSLLKNLMLENDATAQFMFSWGPGTKMHNAIKAATEAAIRPVRGRIESGDTTSRIYEVLMGHGAQSAEIKQFMDNVKTVLENERTFGFTHEQLPMTRGINAMGARQLTQQALSAFSHNDAFVAAFEKRYGGNGLERMYVPIVEAYNPAIRAIQRKIEQGSKVGRIQRLMGGGYDAYHTTWGLSTVAVGTHALAKFIYPLVRFTLNPLYHVYNATESDIIGITQDGMRVKRASTPTSAEVFSTVERGNFEANAGRVGQQKRMESMGMDPALDAYTDELIRNATLDQTGVPFGYNSRRAAIMERQVDIRRPETITDAIRQFTLEDPAVQAALKRYGGNIDDWVDGLTQDIYGIDKTGARKYIGDLLKQDGWTPEEFAAMEPLITEVTSRMQQSMDDIYQLHVGNADRSRIERVLNSYWLFWPASYMLKANKWMFKVLTEGAFGRKTHAGGAWTLNELSQEYHRRYVQDEEFRTLVDDNDDLLFVLSSILPVAPWSDGVALNRMTRFVGGHVGLWPQYTNFDPVNVTEWGSKMGQIGPAYSLGLVGDVTKGLAKTLDINLEQSSDNIPQSPQSVPGMR